MKSDQQPTDKLDLSLILHTIMAARGLTVGQIADIAGVSKSAMEKYLAGPSSPRAVAIANLAKGLQVSADMLLFGEREPHIEAAFNAAFRGFVSLVKALKADPDLAKHFEALDADSSGFIDFAHNVAFEHAGRFRRTLTAASRDERVSIL